MQVYYYWSEYQHTLRNLETQDGFIQNVEEQALSLDFPFKRENYVKLTNPFN